MALVANNIVKAPKWNGRDTISTHAVHKPRPKPSKKVSDYHYDMKTITKR